MASNEQAFNGTDSDRAVNGGQNGAAVHGGVVIRVDCSCFRPVSIIRNSARLYSAAIPDRHECMMTRTRPENAFPLAGRFDCEPTH